MMHEYSTMYWYMVDTLLKGHETDKWTWSLEAKLDAPETRLRCGGHRVCACFSSPPFPKLSSLTRVYSTVELKEHYRNKVLKQKQTTKAWKRQNWVCVFLSVLCVCLLLFDDATRARNPPTCNTVKEPWNAVFRVASRHDRQTILSENWHPSIITNGSYGGRPVP